MDKTALALLETGDIEGLLQLHYDTFGPSTMTTPVEAPPNSIVIPAAPPAPPAPSPPTRIDMNDPAVREAIEAARRQEKDKLYPELEAMKAKQAEQDRLMATFAAEREEREKREQDALAAAEAAAEEKRLAELSYGEKLTEFQSTMQTQIGGLQEQLAQRDALLDKERQFTELMQYRGAALANEDPNGPGAGLGPAILPQLRELVVGNTREEIDQSISALAERSGSILNDVAAATQGQRQQARGVGVTAPPVGPLDNDSGYQTISNEDLRAMDMTQYAQLRGRLLGAAATQQRDRGMFG